MEWVFGFSLFGIYSRFLTEKSRWSLVKLKQGNGSIMRRLLIPSDHNHLGTQPLPTVFILRNSQIPGYSSRNNVYAMYLWHVGLFPKKCLRRICGSGVGVGDLELPLPQMSLPCFYFWEKMPEESFFASGFGSSPPSPAAPGQFNIQEEHWKVREVSKSSNHNYKDGKQNLESRIQEAFWFFKDRWKGWLICQCLHVPGLFKIGKVEVMFLEAVEEIISALSLWLQKGKDLMLEVCSRLGHGLPMWY